jgi:hypothetical protein
MKVLQSIVPQLLKATSYDLYCVLEFTRQYNIPDSYPCLHFVQALLLDYGCSDYASRITGVLEDVHKHEVCFYHSCDYRSCEYLADSVARVIA